MVLKCDEWCQLHLCSGRLICFLLWKKSFKNTIIAKNVTSRHLILRSPHPHFKKFPPCPQKISLKKKISGPKILILNFQGAYFLVLMN